MQKGRNRLNVDEAEDFFIEVDERERDDSLVRLKSKTEEVDELWRFESLMRL
jgi:hypothetical protein